MLLRIFIVNEIYARANKIFAFFCSLDPIVKNLKKNFTSIFNFSSGKNFRIITVIIVNHLKLLFNDYLMRN